MVNTHVTHGTHTTHGNDHACGGFYYQPTTISFKTVRQHWCYATPITSRGFTGSNVLGQSFKFYELRGNLILVVSVNRKYYLAYK